MAVSTIGELTHMPAMWGLMGAFIYAGPRWVIALMSSKQTQAYPLLCTLDLMVCLIVGAIGAAAFGATLSSVVLTTLHLKDDNAICAVIGLLANRMAPLVVEKSSDALDGAGTILSRVLKALKGDEK